MYRRAWFPAAGAFAILKYIFDVVPTYAPPVLSMVGWQ
jgi:hypothetical protein